ncbi:MAG: hypothetical protein KFB93_01780 [Simkaniaceae bacterium]|nr:MAG: hypothetical protein KFB93_01780 [Simkaniaceae bacterium]
MCKIDSIEFNTPLFYIPFDYSEELMLSETDYSITKFAFPENYVLSRKTKGIPTNDGGCLSDEFIKYAKSNELLIGALRYSIAPKKPLPLVHPPEGVISVAVHIRKGIIFDGPQEGRQIIEIGYQHLDDEQKPERRKNTSTGVDHGHPLKFPPEQYYIDQIRTISHFYDYQPLYVYLFTDHPFPEALAKRIERAVSISNITFDFRKTRNRHDQNVLVDLFSMSYNFDCLIRPGHSSFSVIAHLLGNHQLVIYPTKYKWEDEYCKMGGVIVEVNETNR